MKHEHSEREGVRYPVFQFASKLPHACCMEYVTFNMSLWLFVWNERGEEEAP